VIPPGSKIYIASGCVVDFSLHILVASGGTASRVTNLLNISRTSLKTPGSFLTFQTEIGLVDELRFCFQR